MKEKMLLLNLYKWHLAITATILIMPTASLPRNINQDLEYDVTMNEDDDGLGIGFPVALNCSSMATSLVDEIASYRSVAGQIADYILNGPMKGMTYQYLANFVDKFGSRLTGTQNLEDSIDYLVSWFKQQQLSNVHTEDVTVPVWRRGNESLKMLQPRFKQLAMLGLGGSIGTPPEGITGKIIVVNNFTELDARANEVPGKIVVYNERFITYSHAYVYRENGASYAAQYGAVAVLVRSAATLSIYSPHTGWQDYHHNISLVEIPAASITIEDAEMFRRMTDRGQTVVVTLYMEAQNLPDGISRNTVAEWSGTTYPSEAVIVSGHIDSWDVGQGAMDDGGGSFISIMTPYVLSQLGLETKRPVRTVLWTSEETGNYNGAYAYADEHSEELANFTIVIESDEGVLQPMGLAFSGTDDAACIIQEILKLADTVNATQLFRPDIGHDTPVFSALGVPTAGLMDFAYNYFDFHHSNGDTMTVMDAHQMDKCLVLYAVSSYVLANLTDRLPR